MERKRKVIYFNIPLEKEILEWAESTNNFSKYIKQLIKDDIQKERTGLDPKVIEWLKSYLDGLTLIKDDEVEVSEQKIDFSFIQEEEF